jgi:CheY-like chemotaxis protein
MDSGFEAFVSVLLVGRSANSIFVLRDNLQKLGCSVSALHSCEGALKKLRQEHFDFVLSEFFLPGATSYQLLAHLRGSHSSLFFCIPVEDDSWWIPALSEGRDCLGAPAIRSAQFARALQEIVERKRGGTRIAGEEAPGEAREQCLGKEFSPRD